MVEMTLDIIKCNQTILSFATMVNQEAVHFDVGRDIFTMYEA